jgi:hypothetical protein
MMYEATTPRVVALALPVQIADVVDLPQLVRKLRPNKVLDCVYDVLQEYEP